MKTLTGPFSVGEDPFVNGVGAVWDSAGHSANTIIGTDSSLNTSIRLVNKPDTVLLFDFYGQMLSIKFDAISTMTLIGGWRAETSTSAVTMTERSTLRVITNDGRENNLDFGSEAVAKAVMIAILERREVPPYSEIYPKTSVESGPVQVQSPPRSFEEV